VAGEASLEKTAIPGEAPGEAAMDELAALGEVPGEVAGDARNVKTTIPGEAAGEARGEVVVHGSTALGDISGEAPGEATGDFRDVKSTSRGDVGGDVDGPFATRFPPPPWTFMSPASGGDQGTRAAVGMGRWFAVKSALQPARSVHKAATSVAVIAACKDTELPRSAV
jgi:hypothetical protein